MNTKLLYSVLAILSLLLIYLSWTVWWIKYSPKFVQRWFYRLYKQQLMSAIQKINDPLYTYPFLIFIQFSLDSIFETKGFEAAQTAAREWPEKFTNDLTNNILSIGNESSRIKVS
jgi:hypothetical protein